MPGRFPNKKPAIELAIAGFREIWLIGQENSPALPNGESQRCCQMDSCPLAGIPTRMFWNVVFISNAHKEHDFVGCVKKILANIRPTNPLPLRKRRP